MTPDGILTVVGLLLAAYQVMPRARRLDLRLRFGPIAWAVTTLTVAGVVYLQFFPAFATLGLAFQQTLSKYQLSPDRASFLLVLIFSAFLFIHLRSRRLPLRMIYRFRDLVEELLSAREYPHLITLLSTNLPRLVAIARSDLWSARFRRRFLKTEHSLSAGSMATLLRTLEEIGEPVPTPTLPTIRDRLRTLSLPPMRWIARLVPDRSKSCETADGVLTQVLTNREFAAGVIASRVYFGLELTSLDRQGVDEFFENYMRLLFVDTSSVLYAELQNAQNISTDSSYFISSENRVLYYLFNDARKAEHLEAWRPIGESMLAQLDGLVRNPHDDPYNLPVEGDFRERGRWDLSLCAGLHYFDLMVTAALHQGVTWHMWLFYFPYFAERIARNYAPVHALVDLDAEWPGRYAFLAYEMVSRLRNWILAVGRISPDQPNVRLANESLQHENGNIPKSSILALGHCLRIFLEAPTLPDKFKRYLAEIAYQAYFRLREECRRDDYARVLTMSIRAGGPLFVSRLSPGYRDQLVAAWANFDMIPHSRRHLDDFETGLFG